MKLQGQPEQPHRQPRNHPGMSLAQYWYRLLSSLFLSLTLWISSLGYAAPVMAQTAGQPFNCDGALYISQAVQDTNPTQLTVVNTAQAQFVLRNLGNATATYNSAGFRTQDGYIYGIRPNAQGSPPTALPFTVYQIGTTQDADGNITGINTIPLGVPVGIPPLAQGGYFAGDFAADGTYYVYAASNGALVRIDVENLTAELVENITVPTVNNTTTPQLFDIALNPVDGRFYGYDQVRRRLIAITPANGDAEVLPIQGPQTGSIGAAFFDAFGNFYAYDNNGPLYRVDIATGNFQLLNNVQAVSLNDGASCPFAPQFEKIVAPSNVQPGDTVTYTYRVRNSNLVRLTNATFSDRLPAEGSSDGRTFVENTLVLPDGIGGVADPYGGTNELIIRELNLEPGVDVTFSVDVRLSPDAAPGGRLNQARFQAPPPSPIPGSNTSVGVDIIVRSDNPDTTPFPDPTPIQVGERPLLGVAKQAGTATANSDGSFTIPYTIVVQNYGNLALSNLQVVEDLTSTFAAPATFTIATPPSSPDGLAANPNFNGLATGDTNLLVPNNANNTLAVGQSRTINFSVQVTPNGNFGPYDNTAVARGTSPSGQTVEDTSTDGNNPDVSTDGSDPNQPPNNDGNPTNNSVPTRVSLNLADLSLTKTVNNPNPAPGEALIFTIALTNNGPSPATNVEVSENLPAGFSATAPAGTTYSNGVWSIPTIAPSQTLNLVLQGPYSGTPFVNVAQVTRSDQPDPDSTPGNNDPNEDDYASVSIPSNLADLSLAKAVNTANPAPGEALIFTIALTNNGPSPATNVEVSENLPAGFSATAPAGTTYSNGVWSIPTIAPSQTLNLVLQGPYSGTPFVNVAQVTRSDQPDPDSTPGNNDPNEDDYASVSIPSVTADLSLTKVVDNPAPSIGDTATFTITLTNNGPDTATNVEVAEPGPTGVSNVTFTPETGTYSNGIWRIPSLANGASTRLLVSGTVDGSAPVRNTAEVTASDQVDPNSTPGNNNPAEDDQGSVAIDIGVNFSLTKRITAFTRNGAVTRLTNVVNNPPRPEFVGDVTLPPTAPLSSQDQVEYTIYFSSTGGPANNVAICDAIPESTVYADGSLQVQLAGATAPTNATDAPDADPGQFIRPLVPTPAPPCANAMNPNVSALFNVGNVPAGNFGFVRFSVRVP